MNPGFKGYGSGNPFHPFPLGNPSYFKNIFSD
jgi:hypothetical protein